MDAKKLSAFFVLAVFLLLALPSAIAENGDRLRVGDSKGTSERAGYDRELEVEIESNITKVKIETVDQCVEMMKERQPNITEARLKTACENALLVRTQLAPKFEQALPRIQRFMVQNSEKIQSFLEKLDDKSSEKIKNLDRARLKECLNDTDDCKERIKNWTLDHVKVKDLLKKRFVAQDKLLEFQSKYLKAKQKYLEVKGKHLEIRDEFLGLKDDLVKCKASKENCTELENKTFEKAQEDLLAISDRLIQHLEKLKSKVEGAENLNETEVDEAIDKIDSWIEDLEDAKDDVEAADNLDELKEASEAIRAVWKDMQYSAFRYAERVIYSTVGQIFSRSELLEKKLETVIVKLKDKEVNTTEMEDLLDNFSAKVDDAREKMRDANDMFEKAKDLRDDGDTEGTKDKLEEAKNLTREAHQDLKEAHKILMDLVHKINQNNESFDPDEVSEDEEVEHVEED